MPRARTGRAYLPTMSAVVLSGCGGKYRPRGEATRWCSISMQHCVDAPDQGHPHGHGRIEHLASALRVGRCIGRTRIFFIGWTVFFIRMNHTIAGMIAIGSAALINVVLGMWLVRTGKR